MQLSPATMSMLAGPFENGNGPSHDVIETIWTGAGAIELLPEDGSKSSRVLRGLDALQRSDSDEARLRKVVFVLSARLQTQGELDMNEFQRSLEKDGLSLSQTGLESTGDRPDVRLEQHVEELFGSKDRFEVARRHYRLGNQAWRRHEWESANAQYRSACDAVFNELALSKGCPSGRKGGQARQWLEGEGLLSKKEAALVKAFMDYAGENGSHAGVSDAAECQLRRHFATAIITFALTKLG